MRQHLIVRNVVPPGGFRVKCPHCQLAKDFPTWNDMVEWVKKHNASNNHEEWDYETQLCEKLPPGVCMYENGNAGVGVDCRVTISDLEQGMVNVSKLLWDHATGDDVFVSQEEAERRADICTRCQMNVSVEGCQGCKAFANASEIIGKIVGTKKLSSEQNLQQCCICKCSIKTIAWIRNENLKLTDSQMEQTKLLTPHCWKLDPLLQVDYQ